MRQHAAGEYETVPRSDDESASFELVTYVSPISHETHDQYQNEQYRRIGEIVLEVTEMGFYGDTSIDLERSRSRIDYGNPATQKLIERIDGLEHWLESVPRASALAPIYDPRLPLLENGNAISPELYQWLCNIDDAIGIRSRAAVLGQLIEQEVARHDWSERPMEWASLACGAAQPVLKTAEHIQRFTGGPAPNVTLVDFDTSALRLARSYADEYGVADSTKVVSRNLLAHHGIADHLDIVDEKEGGLPVASYDVVDAVGFFEYLKDEDSPYVYKGVVRADRAPRAGAVTFLKNAYELVRPGGVLLFGNMRDTHPQLQFTLNAVQWPHIRPRSIEQVRSVIAAAGIDDPVTVHTPTDNVYAVYALHKPDEGQ